MKKYYKFILFFTLLIISGLFLISQSGLWLVQDAFYWPKSSVDVSNLFRFSSLFQIFNRYEYFHGIDYGEFSATRIFYLFFSTIVNSVFGVEWGQSVYIFSAIAFAFYGSYRLLGIFSDNKDSKFFVALLYTFSPLLFSLFTQSYLHIYGAIPLFLYSGICFFSEKNFSWKYLLINIFSVLIIISYLRFVQVTAILGIIIFIYFFFQKKFHITVKKVIIFFIAYLLGFLPTIFLIVSKIFNKESLGSSSYAKQFENYIPDGSVIEMINFFKTINIDLAYHFIYIFLAFAIFFGFLYSLFNRNILKKNILSLGIIFIGITLYVLPIFPQNIYKISLKFFPFLQNAPYYAYYIIIIGVIIFLVKNIDFSKGKNKGIILFVICISVLPLLSQVNPVLKKIDINNNIPIEYKEKFNKYNPEKMFLSTLYLYDKCWYAEFSKEYPTCYNYGYDFSNIYLNNPRLLHGISYEMTSYFYRGNLPVNIEALKNIYDLKYIIKPKDIKRNPEQSKFLEENKFNFINNFPLERFNLLFSSGSFNIYGIQEKDKYNYFIYSPNKIIFTNFLDLMTKNEEKNYDNVFFVDNVNLADKNIENVKINFKQSPFDFSKYFLKIQRQDLDKDFMIQFNQTFGNNWKLKWIIKEDFEAEKCIDEYREFEITQNETCNYKAQILDLTDTKFLDNPEVPNSQHFEGNFIGNAWLIKPENIPENMKNSEELYAVIIYEKQIWYNWALLVSGLTFGFLLIFAIFQEIKNFKNRKNEK